MVNHKYRTGVNWNKNEHKEDQSLLINKMIKVSRQTGKLNISSQHLDWLPSLIFEDEAESKDIIFDNSSNWWEAVDLVRLIAADNMIKSIDNRIGDLGALVYLDLHGNQINTIPLSLMNLENLQILNLSYNNISEFPSELCDLNLCDLQLQNNHLTDLPNNFGFLVNLSKLDLSSNKLESLPESMSSMTKLTELNLSSNSLKSLDPLDLNRLELLRMLILNHNQISKLTFRKQINLPRLEIFDIKYNLLKSWTTILSCPRLKDFCCGFNKISCIEDGAFDKCADIEVFDVRDNNIGSIPADILKLYKLKRLDITNNSISILPPELHILKSLVSVHLTGNPIRGLPTSGGTVKLMEYLSKKYVPKEEESTTTRMLPKAVNNGRTYELSGLQMKQLDVSEIQKTSSNLPTSLNLAQNQLRELPSDFHQLSSALVCLSLNKNQLSAFPKLSNCANLVTLDLSDNLISTCINLAPFSNLNSLNLNNNRLKVFPALPFPSLSVLLLASNKIENIDMLILNQMKSLHTLDLSNNDIQRVPPELGKLTSLNNLQLTGNPFRIPRNQILMKGTVAILEYLRSRIVE